jgi:Integrase core domain
MIALAYFVLAVLASQFKSKSRLEAENAVLRHQLIVLQRKVNGQAQLSNNDRWFFVQLCRWFPSILQVVTVLRPETLVRWHRAGFRRYWRWKSNSRGGRPRIEIELRGLIRQMSTENQLWGAPRIHGELLKLGLASLNQPSPSTWSSDVDLQVRDGGPFCETTLRTLPPWTCSLFRRSVSTCSMRSSLSGSDRRDLVWINVTANPTAEWVARQITEAFPWDEAPHYLIRDRDRIYGSVVARRLRTMGIRDKPTAPASPWQNGFAERLIGSIRRECVDHIIVLGEMHLRRVMKSYAGYYNPVS